MSPTTILKRILPSPVKSFVHGYVMTSITAPWIKTVQTKAQAFKHHRATTETLALGSSHGEFGFIPSPGSFNLCLSSQDLYYSYKLYQKFGPNMPKLKNVVLFYSVFSPGFEVDKTSEIERCSHYKSVFGLPYSSRKTEFSLRHLLLNKNANKFLCNNPVDLDKNYLGEGELIMSPPTKAELTQRIQGHYKHNQRTTNQTRYIARMAAMAKENKQCLVVVIAPCQSVYTSQLPATDVLFSDLFQLQAKSSKTPFHILNLYTDTSFTPKDFVDSDHLNKSGAIKLTDKLKTYLQTTT